MAKNRYILVLSGSIAEGNRYAKRAGLPRFSYRAVGSAKQVRNIQVADVHILSDSFHARPDKHSILGALRYGRDIRYFTVEMPPALEVPPTDQGDGMGEQLELELTAEDIAELDAIEPFDTNTLPEDDVFDLLEEANAGHPEQERQLAFMRAKLDSGKPERVLTSEQHERLKEMF